MRFAGTRIEGFLGDKPDYGKIATGASTLRSKESQAATNLMGQTAAAGISAAGQVKGAKIKGEAQSALAQAQGNAAVMKTFGQIAGAGITAAGDAGLFGHNYGDPGTFGNGRGIDHTDYSWNASPKNYEPGAISTPGWSWDDL